VQFLRTTTKKRTTTQTTKARFYVNNKEMEVALWLKTSAKGVKFLSASFSEPYVKTEQENKPLEANDDLPFCNYDKIHTRRFIMMAVTNFDLAIEVKPSMKLLAFKKRNSIVKKRNTIWGGQRKQVSLFPDYFL
jgi:hypothetical protein